MSNAGREKQSSPASSGRQRRGSRGLSRRTPSFVHGGRLWFLLMLPLMLGACQTTALVTCRPDLSLLQDVPPREQPPKARNGDLAVALRELNGAVAEDNARKRDLREQLRRCE